MGVKTVFRQQMTKLLDKNYEKKRKRCQLDYVLWVDGLEQEESRTAPADVNDNDFELLVFGEGSLAKRAKEKFAECFAENPQVLLAYGDEDVEGADGVSDNPWLKPDWSPDSYLCRDYFGSVVAVRKSLYAQLKKEECMEEGVCHDRLVELAGGFERGCGTIAHVRGISFHRKVAWPLPGEGRKGMLPTGMDQNQTCGKEDLVSVIIPSKDNVSVLKHCLETLCKTVKKTSFEIIVVDNGSSERTKKAVMVEMDKLNCDLTIADCLKRAIYLYEPMEFNFSRMCNLGAKRAKGNLLLFLNDDMEAVEDGWMEKMAGQSLRPWTGAVGMKLWYPDSDRIQHAGITNTGTEPLHKLQYLKDNRCYYDGRNRGIWNVLAVTGACLMLRKELFTEIGGFAENMQVAYNDVDLCFSLREKGYWNVVINTSHLLHHESLSRGNDESEVKMKRLAKEREILYKKHPGLEGRDPFYHPWLSGNPLDSRIVPAFKEGRSFSDIRGHEPAGNLNGARKDACFLLRIESADRKRIQGYAIVLGSDNACFAKQLLLQSKADPGTVYCLHFREQYRSDLEENMPDQKNVALCGFNVELAGPLPQGEYRIGALAKDKISGLLLQNWSSRTVIF